MITFDLGRQYRSCTSCGGCGYIVMAYENSDFNPNDLNNVTDCKYCGGTGQIIARRASDWPRRQAHEGH